MSEPDFSGYSLFVAQASGMVSVQATCSIAEALALMESSAELRGETLEQVAVAIIGHRITFAP